MPARTLWVLIVECDRDLNAARNLENYADSLAALKAGSTAVAWAEERSGARRRSRVKRSSKQEPDIILTLSRLRKAAGLIRHQHRQSRVLEDVAGRAPKNHLPQTALSIGAFDEEIAAERLRGRQNGLSGRAAFERDGP
jgi:hypothetical protein